MEGISAEGRLHWRVTLGLDNLCWVYDKQSHHHRGKHPYRLHRGHRGSVSWVTDGTSLRVGDANDIDRIEHALEVFRQTKGPAPPSSSWTATSGTARHTSKTRPRPTESRSAMRRIRLTKRSYGWPEDAKFLVPDGVREHFAAGVGRAGR